MRSARFLKARVEQHGKPTADADPWPHAGPPHPARASPTRNPCPQPAGLGGSNLRGGAYRGDRGDDHHLPQQAAAGGHGLAQRSGRLPTEPWGQDRRRARQEGAEPEGPGSSHDRTEGARAVAGRPGGTCRAAAAASASAGTAAASPAATASGAAAAIAPAANSAAANSAAAASTCAETRSGAAACGEAFAQTGNAQAACASAAADPPAAATASRAAGRQLPGRDEPRASADAGVGAHAVATAAGSLAASAAASGAARLTVP